MTVGSLQLGGLLSSEHAPPIAQRRSPDFAQRMLPDLLLARKELPAIEKRRTVTRSENRDGVLSTATWRFADLQDLLDVIQPVLLKHNILLSQDVVHTPAGWQLVTLLEHASGAWMAGFLPFCCDLPKIGSTQEMAAQITMHRRHALGPLLGFTAQEVEAVGETTETPEQAAKAAGEGAPGARTRTAARVAAAAATRVAAIAARDAPAARVTAGFYAAPASELAGPDPASSGEGGTDVAPSAPPSASPETAAAPATPEAEEPPRSDDYSDRTARVAASRVLTDTLIGMGRGQLVEAAGNRWKMAENLLRACGPVEIEVLVDAYRRHLGAEPPAIDGIEYPPPVPAAAE